MTIHVCTWAFVGDVPVFQVASRPKPSVMPWSEGKTPTERGLKAASPVKITELIGFWPLMGV